MAENQDKKASLLSQWKKKSTASVTSGPSRSVISRSDALLPSDAQKRLWILQQMDVSNPYYQHGQRYEIDGDIDLATLTEAFRRLLRSHEIFSTNFKKEAELRLISEQHDQEKFVVDYQEIGSPDELEEEVMAFARSVFDLECDQLIRAKLWKVAEHKHVLVISIHHIIGDRWSLNIMNQQLIQSYKDVLEDIDYTKSVGVRYRDYAAWKNDNPASGGTKKYWKEQIGNHTGVIDLPSTLSRPDTLNYQGAVISSQLDSELSRSIKEIAAKNNTTTYVVLLTALKVLLYRYTNSESISVGTPFSTRDRAALESVVGFFTDTLVLRSDLSPKVTFGTLLGEVKEMTTEAFAHQDISYDELVQEVNPPREPNRNPLFQVMYINDKEMEALESDGLPFEMEQQAIDLHVSKFDMTLFSREGNDKISLTLEYMTDVLDGAAANRLLIHYTNILRAIAEDTSTQISRLKYLSDDEVTQYVDKYNDNEVELPQYPNMVEAIKSQAKDLNAIAVVDTNSQITYGALFSSADRLCARLTADGVQRGSAVGIFLPKEGQYVIAIMAVLQAGCYYVPLDAEYPEERLQYIIEDAKISHIISTDAISAQLEKHKNVAVINLQSDDSDLDVTPSEDVVVGPDEYAYLIYTSGSTGTPKGVRVTHQNLMTSTFARYSFYAHRSESFLLFSPFSFDSSIAGIFWTLSQGGKLVVPPYRVEQDVQMVGQLMSEHQVTHTLLLPSLYEILLRYVPTDRLGSLNTVMVAGEECSARLVQLHHRTLQDTRLYNEYGPTESSVWCIACGLEDKLYSAVPIGRSIPNYQTYILDAEMQIVPWGVVGQIYVGGDGLTQGYLDRPQVTEEKFVASPFSNDNKLYATGDLARYGDDGLIYFLGRADDQVKIRGHRIELDEIANRAAEITGVSSAVAVVAKSQSGNKSIVCHVESSEDLDEVKIKSSLAQVLPRYMVPDRISVTTSLPMLPNGKVNKAELAKVSLTDAPMSEAYVSPEGEVEEMLKRLWEDILSASNIGRHDNFFSLGGDSIQSIQLVSRVRDEGYEIRPSDIFAHQTIAELASVCIVVDGEQKVELLPRSTEAALSDLQRAFLFNHLRDPHDDEGQLCLSFSLSGPIDADLYRQAWRRTYDQHDILRTQIRDNGGDYSMVVSESIAPDITITKVTKESISDEVGAIKKKEQAIPLDLLHGVSNRLILITDGVDSHEFVWICHHIYLDGWSCGIVMRDVLRYYDALVSEKGERQVEVNSYLTYLNWQTKSEASDSYWAQMFEGIRQVPLVLQSADTAQKPSMHESMVVLEADQVKAISAYCRDKAIAVSTFYEALWSRALGRIFGTDDVTYGVTTSGRNSDFPMINDSAGLYMNIIPHRVSNLPVRFDDVCQMMQEMQGVRSAYESSTLQEIGQAIAPMSTYNLYDSLFVFGNFMRDGLTVGSVSIDSFEGGFSSTLPLTLHVDPQAETVLTIKHDLQSVSGEQATSIISGLFQDIVKALSGDNMSTEEIEKHQIWKPTNVKTVRGGSKAIFDSSMAGRDVTSLLQSIWQEVLGLDVVGVGDDFFELGGTSVQALQVFADIEDAFGKKLHPSVLFRSPTIREVARILEGEKEGHSMIIPMNEGGSRPPFFCLHSGGGHVFFYQEFADLIDDTVPVYSVQPPEYGDGADFPKTMATLAALYIEEMRKVQPHGPYRILSTCFSNALSVEIYHQLATVGETLSEIFIIDSSPMFLIGRQKMQTLSKVELVKTLLAANRYHMVGNMVSKKLIGKAIFSKSSWSAQEYEVESNEPQELEPIVFALNSLFENYNWDPIDTNIRMIRSSQFANWEKKDYHLSTWKRLAKAGVSTYTAEGYHIELFDQPAVKELASIVNTILKDRDEVVD